MIRRDKFTEIYYECMEEIYKASIPSASFKELMETSPKNSEGQIEIPYESYKISDTLLDKIIDKVAKKHKLQGYDYQSLKTNIYLGPSPVSIHAPKV